MKKILALAIALMVVGLAVAPQAQDIAAMDALMADFMAGKITPAEFERRMIELTSGIVVPQELQQQQQQQQELQQQQQQYWANAGWPTAAIFRQCHLPNLQQPAGTTARYNHSGNSLEINISNSTQSHADELMRAIRASGGSLQFDNSNRNDYHRFWFNDGSRFGYEVIIRFDSRYSQVQINAHPGSL